MAFTDADYKFLWWMLGNLAEHQIDTYGMLVDPSSVLKRDCWTPPPAAPLPQDDRPMPYWFFGDDAFRMKIWIL